MYCAAEKLRETNELLADAEMFPDEKITPAITKAQARIDTVLSKRYKTPLAAPVPGIIESITQDMAVGFVLADNFASRPSQELISLSNQYLKRAEADLLNAVNEMLLDGLPGIELTQNPNSTGQPAMRTTTPGKSPVEAMLGQW
ncbi:hypothetical protein DCCM_3251 [Desulfocucumis palustris]|uniref:Phage protein n=1 Tax=Desulfocucumis palustris TaxID=1898651 RepID=A0A2L2XCS3_9FIRM|nr:phage protein Gp36 family protein [Desulfocucumis palustris]GBF34139.1 hypothetical protein DCCM_3251 [Desulfocucumis palustris]